MTDTPPPENQGLPTKEQIYVEIWKKVVDTQMHFNEMCVKSRQLGLTFIAAALGVGIVLITRDYELELPWEIFGRTIKFHVSLFIVLAALFALQAVKILDLNVYHRMLRGSVTFGEDFEENYMKRIFDLDKGMTQAISHYSRRMDAGVDKSSKKYRYIGTSEVTALVKIQRFYNITSIALFGISIFVFIVTGDFSKAEPTSNQATSAQTKPPYQKE